MELNEFQLAFGKKLRQAREEKELSVSQLGKLCGISKSHLSAAERGEQNVCIDTIRRLCIALEKKPCFFFDWY